MRSKSKQTGVTDDQPLIMIVDDDDGVSALIEKRLWANGFCTHRTCDGSETLQWLSCNTPDLLLLDHKLPDMTGKEIIEQLTNRAPFIIISAQGGERFIVEMMKFGALDYIVKDTAFLDLLPSVVNRALEQVKQSAELAKRKEALQWEQSVNKAIAKLSDALLNQEFSIEEISDLVLEPAKELTKSRFGYVGYIDEGTGYLVCPTLTKDVWKQCQMPEKDIVFKKFGGIWGWGLDNRKSVMVNSLSCDQRSTGTPKGHIPIERFLAVPSLIEDKLVGQIAVANSERDYTDRDERLLGRLADIYALALQRKNSEDSLRQSEQRYRSVTQSAVDAIISADSEGKIVSWNYGGRKIFGYTEEE
ncbi:hypothetical protein LCGC14_2727180, partial [marine sediment metagenome]